jgi:choline kinase
MHILPAAGSATRFGGIPKYLLPGNKNGKSLLSLHIEIAMECDISKIIVMTHPDMQDYLKNLLRSYKENVIVDKIISKTMTETIVNAALKWSSEDEVISVTLPDTSTDSLLNESMKNDLISLRANKNSLLAFEYIEMYKGKFGQIDVDSERNIVKDISDKNPDCQYKYIWGGLAISFDLLKHFDSSEPTIGNCLKDLIDDGQIINVTKSKGS